MHPGHGVVFHEAQLIEQAVSGGCVRSVHLGVLSPVSRIDTRGCETFAEVEYGAPLTIPVVLLSFAREIFQE